MLRFKYMLPVLLFAALFAVAGCGNSSDNRPMESASHGHDHGEADDHGHEHGEETGHAEGDMERPTIAVTQWTEQMELFMEYPAMVVNQPGRFIIHLTVLNGFQPVREGSVRLQFISSDGHAHDLIENQLLREGIFAPTVSLHDTGDADFILTYSSPTVQDTFLIGGFTVYPSVSQIPHEEEGGGDEIGFLKEQQWKIPFATAEAEVREIKRSTWAIGDVLPDPNGYSEIIAPVDGIVQVLDDGHLALPGSRVTRGEKLVRILPPVQGNSWVAARLAYEQAEKEYERAKRLQEKQAISVREFEGIRSDYLEMKAGFESLNGSAKSDRLILEAPINGTVIDWQIRPGQQVTAGTKLMAIADPSTVWLQVNVYEDEYTQLGRPVGAFIRTGGEGQGWVVGEADMNVLTTGGALDPKTRTIPVLLEIANREGRLRINESTPVELYASLGSSSVAVPRSALYEDEGMDVVFVQAGGEAFEKRVVQIGPHYNDWVSILSGIAEGEHVVTRGGYHVKLASTSAEIGHGHAH
ncbi:efflux RND transporter periplasmic adaptor subunit [bacterium]|nr:efflux RND transporter periplasmic adaptor subunit [bacterium]